MGATGSSSHLEIAARFAAMVVEKLAVTIGTVRGGSPIGGLLELP